MNSKDWEQLKAEQIGRLVDLHHQHQKVPQWAVLQAKHYLDRDPHTIRRWVSDALGGLRKPPFEFTDYHHMVLAAYRGNIANCWEDLHEAGFVTCSQSSFRRAWRKAAETDQRVHTGKMAVRQAGVYMRFVAPWRNHTWQADHTLMDIFCVPRHASVPVRPYLIIFIDDFSRLVVGWELVVNARSDGQRPSPPTDAQVAAVLAEACWLWGMPGRVLVDMGSEMNSKSLGLLLARMGVTLLACVRYSPWVKGKVERFFHTFQRWCIWHQPGCSRLVETHTRKPLYTWMDTPDKLYHEDALRAFIGGRIDRHNRLVRRHGASPLQRWEGDPQPLECPEAKSILRYLTEVGERTFWPTGVLYAHPDRPPTNTADPATMPLYANVDPTLDRYVLKPVLVRRWLHNPDLLELFTPNGKTHLGTAVRHTAISQEDRDESRKRRLDLYYRGKTLARLGSAIADLVVVHMNATHEELTISEAIERYRHTLDIPDNIKLPGVNDKQVA